MKNKKDIWKRLIEILSELNINESFTYEGLSNEIGCEKTSLYKFIVPLKNIGYIKSIAYRDYRIQKKIPKNLRW